MSIKPKGTHIKPSPGKRKVVDRYGIISIINGKLSPYGRLNIPIPTLRRLPVFDGDTEFLLLEDDS